MVSKDIIQEFFNQKHIFIYGVLGRCSSTALQRILNSSGELCIWGEPHGLVEQLLTVDELVRRTRENPNCKRNFDIFRKSFENNSHSKKYANAVRPLENASKNIDQILFELLNPLSPIKRGGFKEITISSKNELFFLHKKFTNAKFLFIFRDPIQQWPSVKKRTCWNYHSSLKIFLKRYFLVSSIYIDFFEKTKKALFIENKGLMDHQRMIKVAEFSDIKNYDQNLCLNQIRSRSSHVLDKMIINNSDAYQNYLKMKKLMI